MLHALCNTEDAVRAQLLCSFHAPLKRAYVHMFRLRSAYATTRPPLTNAHNTHTQRKYKSYKLHTTCEQNANNSPQRTVRLHHAYKQHTHKTHTEGTHRHRARGKCIHNVRAYKTHACLWNTHTQRTQKESKLHTQCRQSECKTHTTSIQHDIQIKCNSYDMLTTRVQHANATQTQYAYNTA